VSLALLEQPTATTKATADVPTQQTSAAPAMPVSAVRSAGSVDLPSPVLHVDAAFLTSRVNPSATCHIEGEAFALELEDGLVYLRHRHWSLVGVGRSALEAEKDLRREASELRDVMRALAPGQLSPDALALRDYLLRFR
jgi:hypothetical protein